MTISPELLDAFRYHRSYRTAKPAIEALELARNDIAHDRKRYGKAPSLIFNPQSKKRTRWIENYSQGLRTAGYADELARLDHTGWYLDSEFQDETVRGIVLRLPGHDGKERLVPAMADPHNDDCALADFESVTDDKIQAAYAADKIAERYAEAERFYQDSWRLGNEFAELAESIVETRSEIIELCKEARQARQAGAWVTGDGQSFVSFDNARKHAGTVAEKTGAIVAVERSKFPTICRTIRAAVQSGLASIRKARERRAEIEREYVTDSDAFREGARQ
jgi:hypothetical protein